LLSTGRPSAPTSVFPEEGHEQEALDQFIDAARRLHGRRVTADAIITQLRYKK
jgi:hypothetical protein